MNVDNFIQHFSAGLAKMQELSLPQAPRAYVELCQTFAPSDPAGMRVKNSALGKDTRLALEAFFHYDRTNLPR